MKDIAELIQKYNRPGPRYTSYPPVPFWNGPPGEKEWLEHVKQNYQEEIGVDLYVHVPFCESLCYYCGCNRTITKNHGVEDPYLASVLKEWELYKAKLGLTFKVNSLHFGGGTPTFMSGANLDRLMSALLENKSTSFIGSIEIDPRTCNDDHLQVLSRHGIKRASLGIQDFHPAVQKAINRDQSPQMVENLVRKLRHYKMESLNFDLIYGLPKQTLTSISQTIDIVSELRPDLIAFYSYAHLPEKIKNQRLIDESDLPGPALKRELYELGRELLLKKGYGEIGIDHFSLPSNFLYQAMNEKRLHRNFMGYVDKKSPLLIGLGPSSISDSSKSFIQNVKDVKEYTHRVQKGDLPFQVGHTHSDVDLRIQDIILQVMCHNEIKLPGKNEIPYGEEILKELMAFKEDGIVEMVGERVAVTPRGKGFVRNVAMVFDYHLREQVNKVKFSQTI